MPRRYPESQPELTYLYDHNRRQRREGISARSDRPSRIGKQIPIFNQDDTSHYLYLLLEGRILLTRSFEEEADARPAVLAAAPSILGEAISTSEQLPHTYSARAFDPTKILVIQRRHLGSYLNQDPDITRAINLAINNDLAALNQRVITLSGGSLEQQVASATLVVTQNGELVLGGTQEDLAMLAGGTRASINKFQVEWEKAGVLGNATILGLPNPLKRSRFLTETGIKTLQLVAEGYPLHEALIQQKNTIPS